MKNVDVYMLSNSYHKVVDSVGILISDAADRGKDLWSTPACQYRDTQETYMPTDDEVAYDGG